MSLRNKLRAALARRRAAGKPVRIEDLLHDVGLDAGPELREEHMSSALASALTYPRSPRATTGPAVVRVSRFELGPELGKGGMGRVLSAHDPDLRRTVAIKVTLDPDGVDRKRLERFIAEAQITSQLQHPNIVPVHEIGLSDDGLVYYVMRRVDGESLRDVISRLRHDDPAACRHWTRRRLLTAFVQVCQAVAYAHRRGVLHRDLKPANIMLGELGEVVVMDWGLARLIGDDASDVTEERGVDHVSLVRTRDGAVVGTPGYMSPEQVQGQLREMDERSDVFSLGSVLYDILALAPAYTGDNPQRVMIATLNGPPRDPRERAPERAIPLDLAAIALRALHPNPARRHPTALALADDIEEHLEGTRRRAEAQRRLAEAAELRDRYLALVEEERVAAERERQLAHSIESWMPLEEKSDLLAIRERLDRLRLSQATVFASVVAGGERALSQDPGNGEARDFLAGVYFERFEDAERQGDRPGQAFYEERVRAYDRGHHATRLSGSGALTLVTDPPGATVWCERYRRTGLLWQREQAKNLGRTPLTAVTMKTGSYLLTIRAPGKRDTRYPVHITRGVHWDSGEAAIPLLSDDDISPGFVYVPAGPALVGGDPDAGDQLRRGSQWVDGFLIARYPVTAGEYLRWLVELHRSDPNEAWRRVPRMLEADAGEAARIWARPGPGESYRLPAEDADGDAWHQDWPVFGIDWHDARIHAESQGARLPREIEWEKATRGVDGRFFPWGDQFDASLAKMQGSRRGRAHPEPVGRFVHDRSPYDVADAAGCIREWMGDVDDTKMRPVRGGAWSTTVRACRLANRFPFEATALRNYIGVRLARPLEPRQS